MVDIRKFVNNHRPERKSAVTKVSGALIVLRLAWIERVQKVSISAGQRVRKIRYLGKELAIRSGEQKKEG